MKLSTDTNNYNTTINKAADFGIQDSDLSHIMGILRSQIYSDKLLAVIREYSTNAVDANVEAGYKGAIDVTLPTVEKPELRFRDFGKGLSDDEVCNLYVKYGASTKRSSNDFTGCLGIGCKAGFAYGDSFQVVSYTKDHITTWLARIDESQRGTISMLNKEPNIDKDTGVSIRVTIRKNDIEDCVSKARKFFKYWRSPITCNLSLKKANIIESTDDWALQSFSDDNGSYYSRNYGHSQLVMGNICYPIDPSQLNIGNDASSLVQSKSVILYAPLGSVDIAANRESLEYTDRTRNAIVAMTNNMLIDLVARLAKHVESQTSRIKASIAADKYSSILPSQMQNILIGRTKWRNQPLISTLSFGPVAVKMHERVKSWRSSDNVYRNKTADCTSIMLTKNVRLVTYSDDKIAVSNATRRIRTLQANSSTANDEKYYVIPKSKLSDTKPQLTLDDVIDLDTVEPLKPNRTITVKSNNGTTTKSVRINVCKLTPANLKSERLSKEAPPSALPDGRYVYVPLDRFDWLGHEAWLDNLSAIKKALNYMYGILVDSESECVIHGVKKHHVKKLDDQWITLDAYMSELFEQWKITNKDDFELFSKVTSKQEQNLHDKEIAEIIRRSPFPAIGLYGKVLCTYHKYARNYNLDSASPEINLFKVMHYMQIHKQSEYLKDMTDYITQKYPILDIIAIRYYATNKDAIATHIHSYIRSVS